MILEPRQIKTQEAILLRIHKGCTLSEAYEKERLMHHKLTREYFYEKEFDGLAKFAKTKFITVCPPSLPRVLSVLGDEYHYICGKLIKDSSINIDSWGNISIEYSEGINRKLLNEDGSDCNLWGQSIETQKTIAELLGVE